MGPTSGLSVDVTGGTITITGELDSTTSEIVERCLSAAPTVGDVSLDLAAVTFVDSTALRTLVLEHQRLGNESRHLRLVHPSPCVLRLLDLTGLTDALYVDG